MKHIYILVIILTSQLSASPITLFYSDDKTCVITFNQPLILVDSDNVDNVSVNVRYNNTEAIIRINSKKEILLYTKTKYRDYQFIFKYNKNAKSCRYSDNLKRSRRKNLSSIKIISSYQNVFKDKIRYQLDTIKYLGSSIYIDIEIDNNSYQDIDISKIEVKTIERTGLLHLKTKMVSYFDKAKTDCNYIKSKTLKKCQIEIKNFKKRGYGLELKLFNNLADDDPVTMIHKFRS